MRACPCIAALLVLLSIPAEAQHARVTGASSSLAGKTQVLEWPDGKPHWTDATFGPASAMDGSLATAWCEGARGPGIGEWIEFQLDQPVQEMEIRSGFWKLSWPPPEAARNYPRERLDDWSDRRLRTCQSNSRPAVLEVSTEKGQVLERLETGDCIGDRFTISLPPGKYRLRIAQVHPGLKFEDTCIAEINFNSTLTQWDTLRGRNSPGSKAQPAVPAEQLPEAIRPLVRHEKCRAASKVKVLPRDVSFLGMSINTDSDSGMAAIYLSAHNPTGLLIRSSFMNCYWGTRSDAVRCVADGESSPDVGDGDMSNNRWVAMVETGADEQQPRFWTTDYSVRWPEQEITRFDVELRVDAKGGGLVATASRDGEVLETARYLCAPAP